MKKLKQSLKNKLTKSQLKIIPSSFDVVGDIAIFNDFPNELIKKQKIIATKLMEVIPSIKVVSKKKGIYSGKLRTPKIEIIAGEKRKTTKHTESGCKFSLNIEKCYFSTRSQNERLRISKKVKKEETILVLFSGISPLPCIISKKTKAKQIYAIELNKMSHKFAKENIQLNKVSNVVLYQGDVKKVVPNIRKRFDRIIMPLPKSAETYLDLALKKLNQKGTIHLYLFANEKDFKNIKKEYKKQFSSVKLTKAGNFGPGVFRICLDLKK